MTQTVVEVVEYGKPKVEEKVNDIAEGTLTKIVGYEFLSHSESVPGCNSDRSGIKTIFSIKVRTGLEKTLDFNGFVGSELNGQEVHYEDISRVTTTLFDPKGREKDPSYRKGVRRTERICRIAPVNNSLPLYTSKETSQTSL